MAHHLPRFSYASLLIIALALFAACAEESIKVSSPAKTEAPEEVTYTRKQIKELKTASKVVYNVPSPSEMAKILHHTKAIYDVEILNDPKSINQYVTDVSRALNLGVYFADLSFTSMFDYPQQAMLYMSAAQGLSEELNIVGVFNEDLMNRLEDNLSNKDSIMDIVSQTYLETDLYLQENERAVIAKAILAGAWIEGLYIATHLKSQGNQRQQVIWEKIGEQKSALSNLINMIEDCNEPQLKAFIEKLRQLESAYADVSIIEEVPEQDSNRTGALLIRRVEISEMTEANIDLMASECRDHIVRVN